MIGINTAIYSPSGGSVGIGFAVPTSLAGSVIAQLRDHGETRRGWLGVHLQTITEEIAETLGLDEARGGLVANVTQGGPADRGGLESGDVILRFDGVPIDEMRRLPRLVAETEVGREVPVVVWRKGAEVTVNVTLGRLEDQESRDAGEGEDDSADIAEIGANLARLTPALRDRYDIADNVSGVVLTGLDPDGNAAAKNLQEGDVIAEVDQDPVSTPGDVASRVMAAVQADRKSVLLLINRDGNRRFVVVPVT